MAVALVTFDDAAVLSFPTEADAREHQKLWPGSWYFLSAYGLWFLATHKEHNG